MKKRVLCLLLAAILLLALTPAASADDTVSTEEELLALFARQKEAGVTDFDVVCEKALFDSLMADNAARLSVLQIMGGIADGRVPHPLQPPGLHRRPLGRMPDGEGSKACRPAHTLRRCRKLQPDLLSRSVQGPGRQRQSAQLCRPGRLWQRSIQLLHQRRHLRLPAQALFDRLCPGGGRLPIQRRYRGLCLSGAG